MAFLRKYKKALGIALALALIGGVSAWAYGRGRQQPTFMGYPAFMAALAAGQVETAQLSEAPTIHFTLTYSKTSYVTNNPRREGFKEYLLLQGVSVRETGDGGDSLLQLGFSAVLIAGIVIFLSRKNTMAKAKNGMHMAPVQAAGQPLLDFSHVAGNPEAKESVMDIVEYLRRPQKFARYGARMPRGILFHGKPGTGKTLMARAMAGEAGVPFYAVSGSDFVQMYVGVGAARVRELFKKAREAGGAVIFIDEIDALGKKRSHGAGGNDEREQTLNALLTEMQGFADDHGIVVVAATNRPDTLDEALMRPGRFDRQVEIALPDLSARRQILSLHGKGKPLSQAVDLEKLAADTVYFSGAMLEGLLNDAAIAAAQRASEAIEPRDISEAYYRALAGSQKKDRSHMREKEREITAWHEAGHAIAACVTNPENRVARVTIIPSAGGAGGFCVNIPAERMYYTKQDLRHQIMVSLAGRAAEALHFGPDNVTTGASGDIEKATTAAMQYVTKFGMGSGLADMLLLKDDKKVAEECGALVDELYSETLTLLKAHFATLKAVAKSLLEKETLDGDEIAEILQNT